MKLKEIIDQNMRHSKIAFYYELFGERYLLSPDKYLALLYDYQNSSDLCFLQAWVFSLTKRDFISIKNFLSIEKAGYVKDREAAHSLIEVHLVSFKDGGSVQVEFFNGNAEGDLFLVKDSDTVDEILNSYTPDLGLGFARVTKDILLPSTI